MKYITILLIALISFSSCNDNDNKHLQKTEDAMPIEIFFEVSFQDKSVDTLSQVYKDVGDNLLGRPRIRLNDQGCLQVGFSGLMFESMSNVACDVKTFRTLYLVTKQGDTIQ